ncbi:MAG: DNA adenine methylase [Armatimonadetes bacterium]|nr:DNA adenine methylase [Armatimonadota bacterium]
MSDANPARAVVPAAPFLKWAGGKSSLLRQYQRFLPPLEGARRYVEPFVGGGALFFSLQHAPSRLADVNPEVVAAYQVVRDQVEALLEALGKHVNREEHFYRVRELDPARLGPVERVARFIYLNKTCFNGLHRVNRQGRFNVPFGRYVNPNIRDAAGLRAASAALQGVELVSGDFEQTTADLGEGDFVYFDPPYLPVSPTANFTDYAAGGFGEAEHRRLAAVFHELDSRGVRLMLSNSSAPLVYELYRGHGYPIIEIQARRAINRDPAGRGHVTELLIINYPRPTRSRSA